MLECLLEKNKPQPAKDQQQPTKPAPHKQQITLIPQPQPKAAAQPAAAAQKEPAAKPKPKIEVVSEVTDYKSMIVETTIKDGKLHYTIELDQIESFASIELDLSSTEVRITSVEDQ
jgi:hypothetical protein